MEKEEAKKVIREGYAKVAQQGSSCCGSGGSSFKGTDLAAAISQKIGYSEEELRAVPEGANLGLGCGNPVALASLKEGDTVLDLGSGAGFDCFLAAKKVGSKGKVIGVDMTPEMLEKARGNARRGDYKNVEFRLGEIENLPVADNFVDVIISNCVISHSPDKERVFSEAFRVLRPEGRLMVSDMVLLKALPDFIKASIAAHVGCISGAMMKDEYIEVIRRAGFWEVEIVDEVSLPIDCMADDPVAQEFIKNMGMSLDSLKELARSMVSVKVSGVKPSRRKRGVQET